MRLIFLLVLFALVSCQQPELNKEDLFDVPTFFEGEINQVKQNFSSLNKTFLYDNKTDSQVLIKFNAEKELNDFIEIDLNKAAYVGAFKKSEIKLDSSSFLLMYESSQQGVDLKKVEIVFRNKTPQSLKFYFEETNNLYESGKELFYEVNKGFVKSGFQRTKFKDPVKYRIEGIYKS
jgi:hypothetical protein